MVGVLSFVRRGRLVVHLRGDPEVRDYGATLRVTDDTRGVLVEDAVDSPFASRTPTRAGSPARLRSTRSIPGGLPGPGNGRRCRLGVRSGGRDAHQSEQSAEHGAQETVHEAPDGMGCPVIRKPRASEMVTAPHPQAWQVDVALVPPSGDDRATQDDQARVP